ncbi:Oidioi.mRNA.OKI2018_I69.chr2.g7152.t1.cds [Oikopleura dioica]|uniref:Oidioi.mRNA.OKI2018_I69.chr2.g7152.t1.cds n=1 Tax=Oikopleura dioica TaxID=34765 RepID=A0ABN7T587_OIKDI|nr:Oidioi.mRNA.OKI2018_I69.chr2.g7152.t1.cds [Oikopleura dioica]
MSDMESFLSSCTDASSSEDEDSSGDDDPFNEKSTNDPLLSEMPKTFVTSSPKMTSLRSDPKDDENEGLFGGNLSPIRGERSASDSFSTKVQDPRSANNSQACDDKATNLIDSKTTLAKDDIGLMDEEGDFDDDPFNSLFPNHKRKSLGRRTTSKKVQLPRNSSTKSKPSSQNIKAHSGGRTRCTGSQSGPKQTKNLQDDFVRNSQELLSTPHNSPSSSPQISRSSSRSSSPTTSKATKPTTSKKVKRRPEKCQDEALEPQVKRLTKPSKSAANMSQEMTLQI